ncbi:MAG: transposase [Thermomicrobia bacterium]|nr:transposase [Thermomicrobia bacterium]
MNAPRCTATAYIDFLVATPRIVSCAEAARVQPRRADAPAHDAFTRLLHRLEPDPADLWHEVAPLVERTRGVLVVDDSTLDKPYARKIALVTRYWSGKHHAVVEGINLITLLWTDGDRLIPIDYRIYDKPHDGITKNEHFLAMLLTARERGFAPECVLFDSWYAAVDNLRLIRDVGWRWLTRLKANRRVSIDYQRKRALETWPIAETGTEVHLEAYGLIRVFRVVATDGDTEHWATDDLAMGELARLKYAEMAWGIEVYHRALKQECGAERAMVRAARAQRNHIGCAIRAFVRLEWHRVRTGIGWRLAKEGIIRPAIRRYLAQPWYTLPASA